MSRGGWFRAALRRWFLKLAAPEFVGPLAMTALRLAGRGGHQRWSGFEHVPRLAVVRYDGLGDLMVTTGFFLRPSWVRWERSRKNGSFRETPLGSNSVLMNRSASSCLRFDSTKYMKAISDVLRRSRTVMACSTARTI